MKTMYQVDCLWNKFSS